MTNTNSILLAKHLSKKLQDIEYGGDTIFNRAHNHAKLKEHYNQLQNDYLHHSIENKESYIEDIEVDIAQMEKAIKLIKDTKSAKEAYYNIINNKQYGNITSYVQYASTYAIEQINRFKKEHTLDWFDVRLYSESSRSFPKIIIELDSPDWTYFYPYYEQNVNQLTLDVFTTMKDYELTLNTFIPHEYHSIDQSNAEIEQLLNELAHLYNKFNTSLHSKTLLTSRKDNILYQLENHIEVTKRHLLFRAIMHERILRRSLIDVEKEQSDIENEFKTILQFLASRLGYRIEAIHD